MLRLPPLSPDPARWDARYYVFFGAVSAWFHAHIHIIYHGPLPHLGTSFRHCLGHHGVQALQKYIQGIVGLGGSAWVNAQMEETTFTV